MNVVALPVLNLEIISIFILLGEGRCFPKEILDLMNTPGLTRMQVASHLQISKALTGANKNDLMKKLPKFIYDEEKALEIQLEEHEHELIEIYTDNEKLHQTYNEVLEFKLVLQKVD